MSEEQEVERARQAVIDDATVLISSGCNFCHHDALAASLRVLVALLAQIEQPA